MLRSQRHPNPPLGPSESPASKGTWAPSPLPPVLKVQALSCPDAKSLFIYMWESQKEVVIRFPFMFPKETFCIFLQLILFNSIHWYPYWPENPDASYPRISPYHPSSHPQNGMFWSPPQG